jgi:hypothetical protein
MKQTILILFILYLPVLALTQPFIDPLNLRYQAFPASRYIKNEQAKMSIAQFTANINFPLELKSKEVIIAGGTFDYYKFTSARPELTETRFLYAANIQLGYLHSWKGGKWKTMLVALPKISSDRFSFTKDAFQMGGVILFTKIKTEKFRYKFGLYYNREFFGNFFVPLAGLEWKVNKRINIYGILPGAMNFEYRLNKNLYAGLSWQSITTSYRVHQGFEKYFVRNGDRFWGHNQIRAFLNYHLRKNILLFAEAGFTLHRKFQLYRNNEVVPDPVFSATHNGLLFNGGVAFRVRLDHPEK